jgi:hypothetical protein
MSQLEAVRKVKAKARRVDFLAERTDFNCAQLGALGFSTRFIKEKTGLSPCQISYRLRAAGLTTDAGLSRQAYRNGESPFATHVLMLAQPATTGRLRKVLRRAGA